MRTSVMAMVLALPGFLVPFMTIYGPSLLLNGSAVEIGLTVITASVGVIALAGATMGYARRPLRWWERAVLLGASLALIFPGLLTDTVGLALVLLVFSRGVAPGRPPGAAPVGDLEPAAGGKGAVAVGPMTQT